MRRLSFIWLLSWLLATGGGAAAAERTLHWDSLEVTARLDAEGRLHVVERQSMVFSGEWNGGERTFRLGPGQSLELHAVRRIDPAGGSVDLRQGGLTRVDHFDWQGDNVLRWRSRLPTDPPFDATTLVYELDYTLAGILAARTVGESEIYRLDHDFAFPNRFGSIERFALDFDLDPEWEIDSPVAPDIPSGPLAPWKSVVITRELTHHGDHPPTAVRRAVPPAWRRWLALGMLVALVLRTLQFLGFERRQHRFDEQPTPTFLNHTFVTQHLLTLRPEEVGALWDRSIGSQEVSALLARLIAERKLASKVVDTAGKGAPDLTLELLVDRRDLEDYERALVDKLFFDEKTVTDTDRVRSHYKSSGFSPTSTIRQGLAGRMNNLGAAAAKIPAPARWITPLLLLASAGCLAWQKAQSGMDGAGPAIAILALALFIPAPVSYALAYRYRCRADGLLGAAVAFLAPIGLASVAVAGVVAFGPESLPDFEHVGLPGFLGLVLAPLAFVHSILNLARTRDTVEAATQRGRLAAARRYFQHQLEQPVPALENGWQPYLLAFGLGGEMERWYKAFGGSAPDAADLTVAPPGTSSSQPRWTGGAVTHTGWASAVQSIAGGVSAPSSSSGGGGGGGGGGSSGGGGGGGW